MEVEIQVANVSSAIVAAANLAWPARTIGLRILDREGREVFGRQRPIADRAKTIPAMADFPHPLGYWAANASPQPSGLVPMETRAAWIGARNTGVDN